MPESIPGVADKPKYQDINVNGLELILTDRDKFRPLKTVIKLLSELNNQYPDQFEMRDYLEKLIGVRTLRQILESNDNVDDLLTEWDKNNERFKALRKKYLIY